MTPAELVVYLRANPTSDACRWAADMIESLARQNADLTDIVRSQAELNESAHAEIGRLRHALECAVASMESGVTSLGAIRVARAALNGESNG